MGARHGKSSRTNGGIGANLRLRNDDRASPSTVVAAVMESGSPSTSTYQRRPEDVVASNGREVEYTFAVTPRPGPDGLFYGQVSLIYGKQKAPVFIIGSRRTPAES